MGKLLFVVCYGLPGTIKNLNIPLIKGITQHINTLILINTMTGLPPDLTAGTYQCPS